MNCIAKKVTVLSTAAALALGGAATAQAKHGADDPPGHEAGEHAGVHHHRHGGRDDARASHHRRGDDDGPRHHRHGSDDDGPNHR